LALRPAIVVCTLGHDGEAASAKRFARVLIELVAHPHVEGALENDDVLIRRMKVRRDLVPVRHLQPERHELAGDLRVSLDDREFGAWREDRRRIYPLHVLGREQGVRRRGRTGRFSMSAGARTLLLRERSNRKAECSWPKDSKDI